VILNNIFTNLIKRENVPWKLSLSFRLCVLGDCARRFSSFISTLRSLTSRSTFFSSTSTGLDRRQRNLFLVSTCKKKHIFWLRAKYAKVRTAAFGKHLMDRKNKS